MTRHTTTIREATEAVGLLEGLMPGQAFTEPAARAAAAVRALTQEVTAEISPGTIEPFDPAVLAIGQFAIDDAPRSGFGLHLVGLHSVASEPVRAFLRSALVVRRVRMLAAAKAPTHIDAEAVADAAVRDYQGAVALQLVDHPELGPAARALAIAVPEFEQRIAVALAKHQQYASGEAARITQEQRAAEEAEARAAATEHQELAQFFKARGGLAYALSNRPIVASAIAALLLGNRAHDVFGEIVDSVPLPEVRLLRRKIEAAEAVTA